MAYVPNSNSVVAFQSDPSQLQASVTGTVSIRNFPSVYGNISGSVISFQGTTPWVVANQGSVATVIIGGSVAASFTPPANQSVSGTVGASIIGAVPITGFPSNQSVSGTVGASLIGLSPVSVSNFPTTQNVSGSVATWLQSTNASVITVGTAVANQSVSGTVGASLIGLSPVSVSNFPTTQNVSGSVVAFQGGTQITSLVNTVPSSVMVGASIFGQLPAGTAVLGSIVSYQGATPWVFVGSVYGNVSGSVAAFQGGTWSTSVMTNVITSIATAGQVMGSVAALQATSPWNVAGSVAAFQAGTIITSVAGTVIIGSIVGTYGEDVPSTAADKGIFTLGIRNDTVASLVGTDLDYTGWSTDSAGRHLVKPFAAEEARVEGYHSVVGTSVTTLVGAAGAGLRNYITDLWFANTGANTTLVTLRSQGGTSILGYTIVPSGGGSNLPGLQTPIRTGVNESFDFQATTASSILFGTAKGYKAP